MTTIPLRYQDLGLTPEGHHAERLSCYVRDKELRIEAFISPGEMKAAYEPNSLRYARRVRAWEDLMVQVKRAGFELETLDEMNRRLTRAVTQKHTPDNKKRLTSDTPGG